MAICSNCVNITSLVQKSCSESGCYGLSLAGGPSIYGFGSQINSSVTNISSALFDVEASVVQFTTLISKGKHNDANASAWECALSYCVNAYSASVMDGVLNQRTQTTWLNNSASHGQGSDLIYNPSDFPSNITGNASVFRVAALAADALNSFMSQSFTGSGGINSSTTGSAFSSDIIHALYDTVNYSAAIQNLALSMTNNIRQQDDREASPVTGFALQTETYVHVRWAWFAYPVALLVISLIYLLGVIIETTHHEVLVWKSSNLALLFHGQGLALSNSNVNINNLSQMTGRARDVEVELIETEAKGWKLVQV